MTTIEARNLLATYGESIESKVLATVARIHAGEKFNGTVYVQDNKKATVYVNGACVLLLDLKKYGNEMKSIFLALVAEKNTSKSNSMGFGERWIMEGMDAAEGE